MSFSSAATANSPLDRAHHSRTCSYVDGWILSRHGKRLLYYIAMNIYFVCGALRRKREIFGTKKNDDQVGERNTRKDMKIKFKFIIS